MISKSLSDFWTAWAPDLGDHLWQSTVFAAVAGLLTLLLRKNHAGVRYCLWLAASIKFLLPFSLLVSLGKYLAPAGNSASTGDFYLAMENVSQPFSEKTSAPVAPVHVSFMANLAHLVPAIIAAIWLAGFTAVLVTWLLRWLRISSAMRAAVPVQEGREVNALRRLEQAGGIRRRISLLLSRSSLEPGIFGIAHPVLVWPEGISDRLEDAHLDAIMAHEVWHVRRRDNLAAALHMLVEAIFWFHPLVWWLGARLIDERERACDEQVLQLGNHPQVYAESILKICEFCVGSPLACVAGVTGADLKQRIVNIMNQRLTRKLDFTRKLLLTSAGLIAIAMPVIFGLANPAQSRAEQAVQTPSITGGYQDVSVTPGEPETGAPIQSRFLFKPAELHVRNLSLKSLIREAYNFSSDDQVSGIPDELAHSTFNIDAKIGETTVAGLQKLDAQQNRQARARMLQDLLTDQFKLAVHHDSKPLPALALVIAKNGPKIQASKPGDTYPNGIKGSDGESPAGAHKMDMGPGRLIMQALPISVMVDLLSRHMDEPVVDRTNLTGDYDVNLHWPTPDENHDSGIKHVDVAKGETHKIVTMSFGPENSAAIAAAIEEQLGLRLDPQTVPMDAIVIDRVEKPEAK
jgi:bla regulator protein BlaR1